MRFSRYSDGKYRAKVQVSHLVGSHHLVAATGVLLDDAWDSEQEVEEIPTPTKTEVTLKVRELLQFKGSDWLDFWTDHVQYDIRDELEEAAAAIVRRLFPEVKD